MNKRPKPFVKWAGGKRSVLKHIHKLTNSVDLSSKTYYEPFVGGGSLFLSLNTYKRAVLNDLNSELINSYISIRDNLDVLLVHLRRHSENHNKDYYYKVRQTDRDSSFFDKTTYVERAARTIYLNRTCYNGLYRVNSRGEFNTPIGDYNEPTIVDEKNLMKVNKLLNKNKIKILNKSFYDAVKYARKGSLVYFDPPYDYEDDNGFVNYVQSGFSHEQLKQLRDLALKLVKRGVFVILSNNDTTRVRKLFDNDLFRIKTIETNEDSSNYFKFMNINTNRMINSKSANRTSAAKEVIIYGSNFPTGE